MSSWIGYQHRNARNHISRIWPAIGSYLNYRLIYNSCPAEIFAQEAKLPWQICQFHGDLTIIIGPFSRLELKTKQFLKMSESQGKKHFKMTRFGKFAKATVRQNRQKTLCLWSEF